MYPQLVKSLCMSRLITRERGCIVLTDLFTCYSVVYKIIYWSLCIIELSEYIHY